MLPEVGFVARLELNEKTGCLEYQGSKDKNGYGCIGPRNRYSGQVRAHRFAYVMAMGEIPEGLWVLHRCDNPSCCNPNHLFLGSNRENVADKVSKGREARGERGGRAKLTNEMVLEIRKLYSEGVTQVELATRFPVTQSSISLIVLRKQWTHI